MLVVSSITYLFSIYLLQGITNRVLITCKGCNKGFGLINKHLAKKPTCKEHYSEEEIKATSKSNDSARWRRYKTKNKEKVAKYNATYYSTNREELVQKKRIYNKNNKKLIARKQKEYQDKYINKYTSMKYYYTKRKVAGSSAKPENEEKDWFDEAGQALLQDPQIYIKPHFPTLRVVKWIDLEQLVDCIQYFKVEEHPEYQDALVTVEPWFMSTSKLIEEKEHKKSQMLSNNQSTNILKLAYAIV